MVFLGLALLLLLLGGGGIAWLLAREGLRKPLRVLLIVPPTAREDRGLDGAEIRALGALAQEHLEVGGAFSVTQVSAPPPQWDLFRGKPRTLLVLLEPQRSGNQLALSYRYAWGNHLPRTGDPGWVPAPMPLLAPAEAFRHLATRFPAPLKGDTTPLTPQDPGAFWNLIRAGAWRLENAHLDEALALAEQVAQREPRCATVWLLLGNLRYRRMLNEPGAILSEQQAAAEDLRRALECAPVHPRAAFLLSLLESDTGNHRQALDLLIEARRRQPANPTLLTGMAYAARGAGLLQLSRRALDLRDRLAWSDLQPQAVDITCLYLGDFARFEASLQERPGHLRSTTGVLPFYRGYLALVRGDRSRAQREFEQAGRLANGYPNIQRLSEIYNLILQSHHDEAWQKLREYDQERIGMREPDGEFTLRLAEAYALMGDRASAMDMAGRAFARGFGCTAWYEQSPLLEPLRSLPKWQALMQHVRERQKLLEAVYPLGLLEEN